jgi:hypothetical protein
MDKTKIYKDGDLRQSYQGDISIIKVKKSDIELQPMKGLGLVVGHSKTGHHHTIVREKDAELEFGEDKDGFFLRVKSGEAKIIHEKQNGHEEQRLRLGLYFFGKQYEYTDFEDRPVID